MLSASVAVFMQRAMRLRHIVLSPVTRLIYYIFSHDLIKFTIFVKNVIEYKMCVLIFTTMKCFLSKEEFSKILS
jgi:hypothetical protein